MSVVSVIGTSGSGKSFLVKQLSALTQSPAFFEGEEGTISEEILASIFNESDPLKRWKFFLDRYKRNLERATLVSKKQHLNCFVDGAFLSARAILSYEDEKFQSKLSRLLKKYEHLKPDLIILLIAQKTCLEKFIKIRSRNSEKNKKVLVRSLSIQNAFLEMAKKEKNIIIIDRTDLDFFQYHDVQIVFKKIQKRIKKV